MYYQHVQFALEEEKLKRNTSRKRTQITRVEDIDKEISAKIIIHIVKYIVWSTFCRFLYYMCHTNRGIYLTYILKPTVTIERFHISELFLKLYIFAGFTSL